ncbi:uncharacterized protein MONBRDRAFT_31676 [Monosiga brevicollis MX1]|uniref:Aminotransferase class I/classII large domain-containing protein n=1 Tax=Monosiga brevicollis TaxID=81824 RepID=A9UV48_MONBE|nr:uncharacterized protein MONBRDRAFT_31676 [Monosiga brevicollis MX1]EDQ91018.1 predicted protein [Monosiga brevicollis MX1]|eukprot:XP_001744315.1 hypothetical protein [Monosiga brevicollis MX1]
MASAPVLARAWARPSAHFLRPLSRTLASSRPISQGAQAAVANDASTQGPSFKFEDLNPHLVAAEYAVRGLLPQRAAQIAQELQQGATNYPFDEVIFANIGNPQALAQPPITFFRQVLSLMENENMLLDMANFPHVAALYPADVIARAKDYIRAGADIGAYSASQGVPLVREQVAGYLERRDGVPADPSDIFLTAGASEGISNLLGAIIANPSVGIMIPIPQYPLYSATITLCNGKPVKYYLDEEAGWTLNADELKRQLDEARAAGTDVRALCVINPGNPTGQVLTEDVMREVVQFCRRERLVLLADEVYQANTYQDHLPFHSFKKVVASMPDCRDTVELASFHSLSKGMIGECGRRGGFMELINFDPLVREQLLKRASINLCCNVAGQVMTGMMCEPPAVGEPSYDLYHHEMESLYTSLRRRALILADAFNDMDGIECGQPQGAMYLFPRIYLSDKAIAAAQERKLAPDTFYCLQLLERTGFCVVPGSGFDQYPGTFHFRCTFLPQEEKIASLVHSIQEFQRDWVEEYGLPSMA